MSLGSVPTCSFKLVDVFDKRHNQGNFENLLYCPANTFILGLVWINFANSLPDAFISFSSSFSILEAQQRLLLVTVFALSVRYQPVDVSLAISSGLLNVLSQLCGTETMLGQPLQLLQKPGVSQLSTALKVASTRLLQILAISTG